MKHCAERGKQFIKYNECIKIEYTRNHLPRSKMVARLFATCFEDYFYTPVVCIAPKRHLSSGRWGEHRRKSTFRIGNIWIITSVRHGRSGQQRYFIEIVNRYRGLAVASTTRGHLVRRNDPRVVCHLSWPPPPPFPFQPDISSRLRNYVFMRAVRSDGHGTTVWSLTV